MVDYKYRDLFGQSHIDKQLKIASDDGKFSVTNEDIHFEDFELEEGICSDLELRFGSCEPSVIKFQIANTFIPLSGKWITITETLDGNTDAPFQYGKYKIFSDVPTADKEYRDIEAYDKMHDIIHADVATWYNQILPNKESKVTMKQFRTSFASHFDLQEKEITLVNDTMIIERTIEPAELNGKDVITAICEINGCFGHIGRDGKLHYIYLPQDIQGLYPSNTLYPDRAPEYLPQFATGHLYPQDPKSTRIGTDRYIKCQYEDFIVKGIDKLQIRKEEGDIGTVYGTGENVYIIEGNFLVYGKGNDELNDIAGNIFGKIRGIMYRPFSCEAIGNPCLEVGDPVRLPTKHEFIETYIFTRTLKGIQSLRDNYTSSGEEKRSKNLNSRSKSLIELKGKTNTLIRNVEETRLTIRDLESGLTSQIIQTADAITAEVTRATAAEGTLSSQITLNTESIALKVTKGDVVSEINQSPEQIILRSNRLIVQSTNFSLDENGNATFSGTVSGGTIVGSAISGGSITCGNVDFTGIVRAGGGDNSIIINENGIVVGGTSGTMITKNAVYTSGSITGSSVTCTNLFPERLNGYTPITSGNIGSYAITPSNIGSYALTAVPYSSTIPATVGTGANGTYVNLGGYSIPTGDWVVNYCTKWFAYQSTVNNLAARVAALEAKG